MNLLESSINIDSNQINAYVQLANLRVILNKNADALRFIKQGLEAIKRLKGSNIPFHRSSISGIQNAAQHLDDIEKMLLTMKRDLS